MDFAALISAVKPRERTDQYKVLSALFLLDAHLRPVTSNQIGERMDSNQKPVAAR
jgi:hypothetical protein